MSNLPMHILLGLHQWTEKGQDGSNEVREELGLREKKEALIPDEFPINDEFLGYIEGEEIRL